MHKDAPMRQITATPRLTILGIALSLLAPNNAISAPISSTTILLPPSADTGIQQTQFIPENDGSQRIPTAARNMAAGIAPRISDPLPTATANEFGAAVYALKFGDETFGITAPEERRKTLHTIGDLHDTWTPVLQATGRPHNADIATDLDSTTANWAQLKPIFDAALSANTRDSHMHHIIFSEAHEMTGNIYIVVGPYSEASKLGL